MRKPTEKKLPPLKLAADIADPGTVRFGSSAITPTALPPLRLPSAETADRGIVRFGSSAISAER